VVHALDLRLPVAEIATPYCERPSGSESKLRTVRDGIRILRTIVALIKDETAVAILRLHQRRTGVAALLIGWPLIMTYLDTGLVPRLPTAVLVTGMIILSCISIVAGLVLDTVMADAK
jgi:hypothetical protein